MGGLSRPAAIIAAIIATFPLTRAIVIPYNLPDGVYEFTWIPNIKGKLVSWTYFDMPGPEVNITSVVTAARPFLPPRRHTFDCAEFDSRMNEFDEKGIDFYRAEDSLRARAMLANWCELYYALKKDGLVVAVVNDMLWYVCNWDSMFNMPSKQQQCARLELERADVVMDKACGMGHLAEMDAWEKTYGRSHRYGNICRGKEMYT